MSRPPLHVRLGAWFASLIDSIGAGWNRLVEPIEFWFGRLGGAFLGAFDSFTDFEDLVVRVVRVLLWPVTAPLGALLRLLGRFVPSGAVDGGAFATLPGRAMNWLVVSAMWLAEKLNLDRALVALVWVLTPVWWPILSLLSFLNAWIATRSPRELALGVPALLLAAPFLYAAVEGATQSQKQIADRYKQSFRYATDNGEHARARLLEAKLAQLGVDTRRTEYQSAASLADSGDLASAYDRMKRLAPTDEPGYLMAHAWIAQNLLSEELTEDEEPELAEPGARFLLAERHLRHAATLGGDAPALRQLLGYALAGQERFEEAAEAIAELATTSRPAAAARLQWLLAAGDAEAAREQGEWLLRMYSRTGGGELSTTEHRAWTLAARVAGDTQQLEAGLSSWRAADPENQQARELLGALRRRQADELLSLQTVTPRALAGRIIEAVELGAPRVWVLGRVTTLVELGKTQRGAQLALEQLYAVDRPPMVLLDALGVAAATKGQIELAREVFEKAIARGGSPVVWNNYAWTLLQQPDPDPASALEAANKALADRPDDPRFRETRGQALTSLKRWEQAIADLEFALNLMPESEEIHRSLALAYEATAQPALAEAHRRLAED